jgi:hypothetical protein
MSHRTRLFGYDPAWPIGDEAYVNITLLRDAIRQEDYQTVCWPRGPLHTLSTRQLRPLLPEWLASPSDATRAALLYVVSDLFAPFPSRLPERAFVTAIEAAIRCGDVGLHPSPRQWIGGHLQRSIPVPVLRRLSTNALDGVLNIWVCQGIDLRHTLGSSCLDSLLLRLALDQPDRATWLRQRIDGIASGRE